MALTKRIIACLDVANNRVVKGVNFENLKDAGDPVELARKYFLDGADELTFLDVNASREDRSTVLDLVRRTAETVFIPLTVGGGIRSLSDVAALLQAGADKVSVGSAAFERPNLLREIADHFGSQVLVASLDVKRHPETDSGFAMTSHGGSLDTGIDALYWVSEVQNLGAGELLVNSIDKDGTRDGFDIELLDLVCGVATVPVVASGGAGSVEHFVKGAETGVDAMLAASIFHGDEVHINEIKQALIAAGLPVRILA
jgi:cyclase